MPDATTFILTFVFPPAIIIVFFFAFLIFIRTIAKALFLTYSELFKNSSDKLTVFRQIPFIKLLLAYYISSFIVYLGTYSYFTLYSDPAKIVLLIMTVLFVVRAFSAMGFTITSTTLYDGTIFGSLIVGIIFVASNKFDFESIFQLNALIWWLTIGLFLAIAGELMLLAVCASIYLYEIKPGSNSLISKIVFILREKGPLEAVVKEWAKDEDKQTKDP